MPNIDPTEAEKHVNDWLKYALKDAWGGFPTEQERKAALAIQSDPDLKRQVVTSYMEFCRSGAPIKYDTVSTIAQNMYEHSGNRSLTVSAHITTALQDAQASPLYSQSRHFAGLVQHGAQLRQELNELDTALVPVAEALTQIAQTIQKHATELGNTQTLLSSAEGRAALARQEAADKNPGLQANINYYEGEVRGFKERIARRDKEMSPDSDMFTFAGAILGDLFDGITHMKGLNDNNDTILQRWSDRIADLKRQLVDTYPHDAEVRTLSTDVSTLEHALSDWHRAHQLTQAQQSELEGKKTYEVFSQLLLDQQGMRMSAYLANSADASGTTLDNLLESPTSRALAKPFADGRLTSVALDAALAWANSTRGNVDLPPEEMALKQFVNRMVIPHIGSFEALASMVDDVNRVDVQGHQPLELLRQKPITFSGKKPVRLSASPQEQQAIEEANKLAEPILADAANIDAIIRSSRPIAVKVAEAAGENETHLTGFEKLFAGVDDRINGLISKGGELRVERAARTKAWESGVAKNERIDDALGQTQFELGAKTKHLPDDKSMGARILSQMGKRAGEGAILAGGASGGLGAAEGALIGAGLGLLEGFFDCVVPTEKGLSKEGELAVHRELIGYLRSQRVDTDRYSREIEDISQQLSDLVKSGEYQAEVGSRLKVIRIRNAYVARSLLRSAMQNSSLLAETCEMNGVESLDYFLNTARGDLSTSLRRLCFGLANSNDVSVILAEADSLPSDRQLSANERALKDFVEHVMKPDISGFISAASKVDVISQSNLLPYGAPLQLTNGIIRDETDPNYAALMANEFGMSVVGVQDVKHIFDFYLYRHGDKQLYDTKLKDGQMSDEYPDKRISVYEQKDVDTFIDKTKQYMSNRSKTIPQVSDMFQRVCAYEYFRPQAVRTAGTNNVFSDNPEAPAAYPMVNATVNRFIKEMSLGPIGKFREVVGERLDNVIAQTFVDYFLALGVRHEEDKKISTHRRQLRESANSDGYGPVFSTYTRRITNDSTEQFQLFLDIYRQDLEKHRQVFTEDDRKLLDEHLAALPDPSKTILTPDIVKPGSHHARLLAAYDDHTLENLSKRPSSEGLER